MRLSVITARKTAITMMSMLFALNAAGQTKPPEVRTVEILSAEENKTTHNGQVDLLVKMPDGNEVKMQCHFPATAFIVYRYACFKPELGSYPAQINKHDVLILFHTHGRPAYNKDGSIKKPGKEHEEWIKFSFED